jgi:hypothetical protein
LLHVPRISSILRDQVSVDDLDCLQSRGSGHLRVCRATSMMAEMA